MNECVRCLVAVLIGPACFAYCNAHAQSAFDEEGRLYKQELKCASVAAYLSCSYYGVRVEYNDLEKQTGEGPETDTSLTVLVQVLRNNGLDAQTVRMTPSEFAGLRYPFIAVVKEAFSSEQHYVFVKNSRPNFVYMIDRVFHQGEVPLEAFLDVWLGAGVVVTPSFVGAGYLFGSCRICAALADGCCSIGDSDAVVGLRPNKEGVAEGIDIHPDRGCIRIRVRHAELFGGGAVE